MGDTNEDWFEQLQQLRTAAGNPTVRAVADKCGLSHSTVFNILAGKHLPKRQTLIAVTSGLTDDQDRTQQLIAAYDAVSVFERPRVAPVHPRAKPEQPAPGELIDAIDRLSLSIIHAAEILAEALGTNRH